MSSPRIIVEFEPAEATGGVAIWRTDDAVNLPATDADVLERAVAQDVELCPLPAAQLPRSDSVEEAA
jgi:hypothetical protein